MRCVALTRICYGDWHWKLAEAYVNLAQGYLQLKGELPGHQPMGFCSPCPQTYSHQRDQGFVALKK